MNIQKFLDLDFVEEMKSLSDDDNMSFFTEMIDEFKKQGDFLIGEINNLFQNQDFSKISKPIHTLKGVSADMGALVLFTMCKGIEIKTKTNDFELISSSISELEDIFQKTLNQLNSLI